MKLLILNTIQLNNRPYSSLESRSRPTLAFEMLFAAVMVSPR